MLNQIKILIILVVIFLNIGCSENKFTDIPDCERIKDESKRDNCFAGLVQNTTPNNTKLNIDVCSRIVDTEIRDLCFFKVAKDGWRFMSYDTLDELCNSVSNEPLKDSCQDIGDRPHLQAIR